MKGTGNSEAQVVVRKAGRYELAGFLIILVSMGSCIGSSSYGWHETFAVVGLVGVVVGFLVFFYSRFL